MSRCFRSLLILAWIGFYSAMVSAADRPNLLLITVDDMSADSVGVYGSRVPGITPNIDQLAREGLRFERAHVQVANCMPSRNVMWSGRYPQSNRVEGFRQVRDPGYPHLVDLAKKAGYFTAIRHKLKDSTPYFPYAWDMELDTLPGDSRPDKKDPKSYGLSTAAGIRAAKSAGKPFFLLINIADPHLPFFGLDRAGQEVNDVFVPSRIYQAGEISLPGFLVDDPVVRQELAHYYSTVRRADDAVGYILQALESSGKAGRTLVMFISDHGMPFPFAKTQLYHHSTRTPLIFRWPGVIQADSVDREHMVSAVDLLPTLADGIGAQLPEGVEGRSFLPLLKGDPQDHRDRVFKAYNENSAGQRRPMRAVETSQFLYIFNPWSDGRRELHSATNRTSTHKRMVELARKNTELAQRLILLKHRVLEELYDIQNDPDCLVNLIADPAYQKEAGHLRAMLEGWMRDTHDPALSAFLGRQDRAVLTDFMEQQELRMKRHRVWMQAVKERMKKSAASKAEM